MDFEAVWAELAPIGRVGDGYRRLPWSAAEAELRAWFTAQAEARGLRLVEDGFGNLAAWWGDPGPGAVLTGSHLDSVVDGGGYDGPLGVVAALAALDLLRDRGVAPHRPLGVVAFAAEEGSRFPVACLGSRLATGSLAWEQARELRDPAGTALADLVTGPVHGGGEPLLDGVARFVELHVEQGRALRQPVGQASLIWPHGRWRVDLHGEANHAGSTAPADRRNPMLTYAAAVLAADRLALAHDARATFGRVEVAPNSTNTVPGRVTGWLDARAARTEDVEALVAELATELVERARLDGTQAQVTAESLSAAVGFAQLPGLPGLPAIASQAGHDAGVLAEAGIATSMLFVRNPTGVSHAPAETASTQDCLAGIETLADVLEAMVS